MQCGSKNFQNFLVEHCLLIFEKQKNFGAKTLNKICKESFINFTLLFQKNIS
jgi:type I restriction-modification system DNA methylase subunit